MPTLASKSLENISEGMSKVPEHSMPNVSVAPCDRMGGSFVLTYRNKNCGADEANLPLYAHEKRMDSR